MKSPVVENKMVELGYRQNKLREEWESFRPSIKQDRARPYYAPPLNQNPPEPPRRKDDYRTIKMTARIK